jgi:hypothetical protein
MRRAETGGKGGKISSKMEEYRPEKKELKKEGKKWKRRKKIQWFYCC